MARSLAIRIMMTDCKQFASCAVATERSYIVGGGCHTDDCKAEH